MIIDRTFRNIQTLSDFARSQTFLHQQGCALAAVTGAFFGKIILSDRNTKTAADIHIYIPHYRNLNPFSII